MIQEKLTWKIWEQILDEQADSTYRRMFYERVPNDASNLDRNSINKIYLFSALIKRQYK
jgi:hypothetical protein